jgi:hypothetical protein
MAEGTEENLEIITKLEGVFCLSLTAGTVRPKGLRKTSNSVQMFQCGRGDPEVHSPEPQ